MLRLALFADDGESPPDLALVSTSLPCVSHSTPDHASSVDVPAVPCSVDESITPYVATFLGVECTQVTEIAVVHGGYLCVFIVTLLDCSAPLESRAKAHTVAAG